MKKYSFLCFLLASLALVTSCKKEQEFVTLNAVIDNPAKVYIDNNRYPCWTEHDVVHVNGQEIEVQEIDGTYAKIPGVNHADYFRAIYPASIVSSSANISGSASVPVTLPSRQKYITDNNIQRVEIPMGAYTTFNGTRNTLQFRNLCSIVRVTITNDIDPTAPDPNQTNNGGVMEIQKISLDADNTLLSGQGTATIEGVGGTNEIELTSGNKWVTLSLSNPNTTMKSLDYRETAVFDIVVPAFSTPDRVVLTIKCSSGVKRYKFNGVHLNPNSVVPLTYSVTTLDPVPAELKPGPDFNSAIRGLSSDIHHIEFVCNCTVPDGATTVRLEKPAPSGATYTPTPIYGYMVGETLKVCTAAQEMYANGSCRLMYANLTNLESVIYGDGFSSEYTTSMQGMFQYSGITSTENLDLGLFRTESVDRMDEMFRGCTALETVVLPSSFDFSNVTTMHSMFKECTSLESVTFPENINTESLINMQDMFDMCTTLTVINNLSNFNTGRVTTMFSTFYNCSSLEELDLSNFNTESVTTMKTMFYKCYSLASLDVSNVNTELVTDMEGMFYSCESLKDLDLSSFNTASVTNMRQMFCNCKDLGKDGGILDLSNFDVSNNPLYYNMCANLAASRPSGYYCTIVCSQEVENMMRNSNSGINLNKVRFVRTRPSK